MIPRKIRHPYQIMTPQTLVVGKEYSFIRLFQSGSEHVNHYVFGGFIDNSYDVAKSRGYDLNRFDKSTGGSHLFIDQQSDRIPLVTIHMDGYIMGGGMAYEPVLSYWGSSVFGWDRLSSFLGDEKPFNYCIVVPKKHWDDDPKIHILDWFNSNDVILRVIDEVVTESAVNWKQRMKEKTHKAMAKMFGCDD